MRSTVRIAMHGGGSGGGGGGASAFDASTETFKLCTTNATAMTLTTTTSTSTTTNISYNCDNHNNNKHNNCITNREPQQQQQQINCKCNCRKDNTAMFNIIHNSSKQQHQQKYDYRTITTTTAPTTILSLMGSGETQRMGVVTLLLLILMNLSCMTLAAPRRLVMTSLEAKVGSHVVFNCHIDFPYDFPILYVVHWSKDNKKIFTWYDGEAYTNELYNGRLHLASSGSDEYGKASLNLTAIRESDHGWYHCQIIFPNRTPSIRNNGTWYQLVVQGGSLIKIPPVNQTIMEGQTAFFHCAMKHPDTSTITWHKDGVPLQDVLDVGRRAYIGKDGSLSIDPTMMSDLGEYECNVRSQDDDENQTAKAFLNIQYKAKVIYAPPEVYLPYGQPAVLDCHFRANPPLKNLRWEKDGLLFDSYNVPGVFYKPNGSLYFAKVDENDAGAYTCTPYNDLGTDGPSPVISVIVLWPPIFSIAPKALYIQKLGESVNMPCEAIDRDGNNRPTIVWTRKDDAPLPVDRHTISAGHLIIEHLIESDRGLYECSATNEAATITVETELMIENIVPRPPYNLTANCTQTSITIRWQPGYLRPSLEYTVWYRLTDAAEWRTLRILQQNVMEATIEHLLPGHEYEFMVLSQDKYGDGMFSKQIRFSTLEGEPERAADVNAEAVAAANANADADGALDPTVAAAAPAILGADVHASALSAPWNLTATRNQQGWLLHWEHPKQGLNALRLYTVRWWKEPEDYLIGNIETYDTFHQVRQLRDDATYKVLVVATSIDGTEVASDELSIDVPAQRKMRALLIGSSVGVIFLLCALCVFLYVKRSCLRHLFTGANDDDDDGDGDGNGSVDNGNSNGNDYDVDDAVIGVGTGVKAGAGVADGKVRSEKINNA